MKYERYFSDKGKIFKQKSLSYFLPSLDWTGINYLRAMDANHQIKTSRHIEGPKRTGNIPSQNPLSVEYLEDFNHKQYSKNMSALRLMTVYKISLYIFNECSLKFSYFRRLLGPFGGAGNETRGLLAAAGNTLFTEPLLHEEHPPPPPPPLQQQFNNSTQHSQHACDPLHGKFVKPCCIFMYKFRRQYC